MYFFYTQSSPVPLPAESILLPLGGGQTWASLSGLCLCYGSGRHGDVSIHLRQLFEEQEMRFPIDLLWHPPCRGHKLTSCHWVWSKSRGPHYDSLGLPFLCALASEIRLPLGLFMSTFIGSSRLQASAEANLGHSESKENSRNTPSRHVIPYILRFLAILPPSFHLASSF